MCPQRPFLSPTGPSHTDKAGNNDEAAASRANFGRGQLLLLLLSPLLLQCRYTKLSWPNKAFSFPAPPHVVPENPYSYANFKAFLSITPFRGVEPVGRPEHLEWLQQHLPLYALVHCAKNLVNE